MLLMLLMFLTVLMGGKGVWGEAASGSKSRGRNDDLPRESSWRNAVHSLTPSGERWQTEGVNRGIALGAVGVKCRLRKFDTLSRPCL